MPVADLLRKVGVSRATFFKWRSKYGGASVSDVKRLRELEVENAKLKRMYRGLGARERRDQRRPQPKAVRRFAKREIAEMMVGNTTCPSNRPVAW